jgi:hypothetical protein
VGETNVQASSNSTLIRVAKPAGAKSVQGTFILRANDSLAAQGQTLVVMKREKVSEKPGSFRREGCG